MVRNRELKEEFYGRDSSHTFQLNFLTPTSFKSHGEYLFFPNPDLVFHSLMEKYSSSWKEPGKEESMEMWDEDTLRELTEGSRILRYNLRTVPFPMEKIHMIGFVGGIRLRLSGPGTMARFARMLFRFGEFSGVGIKTGMGMGAMRMREL